MPTAQPAKKISAPAKRRPAARGRDARPFHVSSTLRKKLETVSANQPLVVVMKLRREGATFAELPVSNDPGNARARAFAHDVDVLMRRGGGQDEPMRFAQRGPSVGGGGAGARASVVKRWGVSAEAGRETRNRARAAPPPQP